MGEKLWSTPIVTIHQRPTNHQLGMQFMQNWLRKHPRAFLEVVEGFEMYNFGIHCLEHFNCKRLRKTQSNLPKPNGEQPGQASVNDVAPDARAGAVHPASWAPGPDVEAPRAPRGRHRRVVQCSWSRFPQLLARHTRIRAAPTDEPRRRRTRAAPPGQPRAAVRVARSAPMLVSMP
jgi:hypothetical protein